MSKPLLILDQHFRRLEELFSPDTYARLTDLCLVEGGRNAPMPPSLIDALLSEAAFYVAANPTLTADQIAGAPNLRAIIEVSGAFQEGLDYRACFEGGIEVLSCSPGFRQAVAEMGLALVLAAARGVIAEHEAFRRSDEHWADDCDGRDFTLFDQAVGFVGYGEISRELHRLLMPFRPEVRAYDPWIPSEPEGVLISDLDTVVSESRVVVVAAAPTAENAGIVGEAHIQRMQPGSALILLSRAHCIDFEAALAAAGAGKITFATDVFPSEPVADKDPVRRSPNVILSPHRAAAVPQGRHPIGDMILHDVRAILEGGTDRQLKRADPDRVASLVQAQRQIRNTGADLRAAVS